MIEIDGSRGEGGGQILRTALTLSALSGRAFRIERIRAGRARPGLMRQHLVSVLAAARTGGAKVEGAELGSTELVFRPGGICPGVHHFPIGSAGSTSLVLQTVLPILMRGSGESELLIEGGTHNPAAPSFDFLDRVYRPALEQMGQRLELVLERPGFYPRGGGRIRARVWPSELRPIVLERRGAITGRRVVAREAALEGVAAREIATLEAALGRGWDYRVERLEPGFGPGNVVFSEIDYEGGREMITGTGQRGVRGEAIAQTVAAETRSFLERDVPVGEHLADQLILPMLLAGGGRFVTGPLSRHAETQLETVRLFVAVEIAVRSLPGERREVEIGAPRWD